MFVEEDPHLGEALLVARDHDLLILADDLEKGVEHLAVQGDSGAPEPLEHRAGVGLAHRADVHVEPRALDLVVEASVVMDVVRGAGLVGQPELDGQRHETDGKHLVAREKTGAM